MQSSKKGYGNFLILTFSIFFTVLLTAIMVNFIIDPIQFYRKTKIFKPNFVSRASVQIPGLLKHYDYDTVVVGSSLTKNYQINDFKKYFGYNTINASIDGLSAEGQKAVFDLVVKSKKAKRVFWLINTSVLSSERRFMKASFPNYLYDNNPLNDLQYLVSKETLQSSAKLVIKNILKKSYTQDLNSLYLDPRTRGRRELLRRYRKVINGRDLSENEKRIINQDMSGKSNRIALETFHRIWENAVKNNPDIEFTLFFVPRTILKSIIGYRFGNINSDLKLKKDIFQILSKYPNVRVFDFEDAYAIRENLNEYWDLSHYSPVLTSKIIKYFSEDKYLLTEKNIDKRYADYKKYLEENCTKYDQD